jgi:Poly(ADP-ribose) polymerase catalytic domain
MEGNSQGETMQDNGLENLPKTEQSRDPVPSFECIVAQSVASLDGDIIHNMTDNALVLVLARKSLTTMLLDGLCWTDRDGDLHVHFRNSFVKEGEGGAGMPRVHLSHGTSGTSSRLLGQMTYILKAWLDAEAAAWPGQKSTAREMFVKRTYLYLKKRLHTLPRHCMHCDKEHEVTGVPMWRPTACGDSVCQLAVRELLIHDSLTRLYAGNDVVALEIEMFASAIQSPTQRRPLLFAFHWSDGLEGGPTGKSEPAQPPEGYWETILQTLGRMPKREQLPADPKALHSKFEIAHPALFKLVRFVLNSFPGYLVQVDDREFLGKSGAKQAFLFHPHDHGKLKEFAQLASSSQYVGAFAFHGSPMFNWLSILRDGLKVASHTKYMSTGASLGAGIYLAKHLQVSSRYSGANDVSFSHFSNSAFKNCVAVCEILHQKSEEHQGGVFVVTDAKRVVVRALLINMSEGGGVAAEELGRLLTALPAYRELHSLGCTEHERPVSPR